MFRFLVGFQLVLDMAFGLLLSKPNYTDAIPFCPEVSALVTFLQVTIHVEYLNSTFAFDKAYCFRYGIFGQYRQHNVYVV